MNNLLRVSLLAFGIGIHSAAASEWVMEFPITQEGRQISQVPLTTDGMEIIRISASDLQAALSDYLSDDVLLWLDTQDTVTPAQLSERGVEFHLNPQTLNAELTLATDSATLRKIGLDSIDTSNVPYTKAALWSWQNNFNLGHQFYDVSDSEETTLDWLGGGNIGGVNGLNTTYRFYLRSNQDDTTFYRGSTQIYFDNTTAPWRIAAGDIEPVTSGHLPGISLGGLSWERAYSDIQPYRQLRNSGTQSLEITESAEVTIYVNDVRISRVRLTPGRYELDDLPLTNGANDIRLDIQYTSGRFETVTYSQFYNGRLLKAGLADFSLSIGVESQQLDTELSYGDEAIAMGFYEYGLTDSLTLGLNGLGHQNGQIAGVSLVNGSDFGNVSFRASTSHSTDSQDQSQGYAASIDFSQQIWGSSEFGSPNFRIGADWQDEFNALPWNADNVFSYTSIRTDYQWYISQDWDANLFLSYRDESDKAVQYDASLKLNWRNQYWRLGMIGEYSYPTDPSENDEYKAYVTVEFFYNLFSSKNRFNASYNSDLKESRVEVRKTIDNLVGDYGYEVSAENRNGDQHYLARSEYNANRWRGQVEVENYQPDSGNSETRYFANVSTGITIADGHVGVGRHAIGSNALVVVHPTLSDSHVYVNNNMDNDAESISTHRLANIASLPRPHEPNSINYSVPDAPLGYSLGSGIERYKPGSLTTHILTVGSDATRTVISTALDDSGQPISLYSGTAVDEEGRQMPIFTNSAGRFVLDGISYGTYHISLGRWKSEITINQDDPILIYHEDLIMVSKEEDND